MLKEDEKVLKGDGRCWKEMEGAGKRWKVLEIDRKCWKNLQGGIRIWKLL